MEADERKKLKPGTVIHSQTHKFSVIRLLGSGGYGDVYMVECGLPRRYALKTEKLGKGDDMRLKLEVQILSACQEATRRSHFVEYLDKGITETFKFVVMGLVGQNLLRIRKKVVNDNFSSSSAIRICMQSFEAIRDLHDVGYIHRDIKLENFAVGCDEATKHIIYILDFGISRPWNVKGTKIPNVPRRAVRFLGTVLYASRAAHRQQEQGRKDDLESWLYMCLEAFDDIGAEWKRLTMPNQKDSKFIEYMNNVMNVKDRFMKNNTLCHRKFPKEFGRIMTYVDGLLYADEPDYDFVMTTMMDIVRTHAIDLEAPWDWEGMIDLEKEKPPPGRERQQMSCTAKSPDDSFIQKKRSKINGKRRTRNGSPAAARKTRLDKQDRQRVAAGELIKWNKREYKVICLLGSGGFGDVYLVDRGDEKKYAMKTELMTVSDTMARLQCEKNVLVDINRSDPARKKYFVKFIDRGMTDSFKFMVMGLVGPNLDTIRRKVILQNFSQSTAIRIAQQSIAAISDLHYAGYIHRDIKPCNFAVGLDGPEQATIFMLDFGIGRRWTLDKNSKQHAPARPVVKFRGTVRFCSRACHKLVDQGRKDDVESWIYMCLDVFDDVGLPWRQMKQRGEVLEAKERFFRLQDQSVFSILPSEFADIIKYVDGLLYDSEPEYAKFEEILKDTCLSHMIDVTKPFDWEGKIEAIKREEGAPSSNSKENRTGSGSGKGNFSARASNSEEKMKSKMMSRMSRMGGPPAPSKMQSPSPTPSKMQQARRTTQNKK